MIKFYQKIFLLLIFIFLLPAFYSSGQECPSQASSLDLKITTFASMAAKVAQEVNRRGPPSTFSKSKPAPKDQVIEDILHKAQRYFQGQGQISHKFRLSPGQVKKLRNEVYEWGHATGRTIKVYGPKVKGYSASEGNLIMNINDGPHSYHVILNGTANRNSELGREMEEAFPGCYQYDADREYRRQNRTIQNFKNSPK